MSNLTMIRTFAMHLITNDGKTASEMPQVLGLHYRLRRLIRLVLTHLARDTPPVLLDGMLEYILRYAASDTGGLLQRRCR